MKTNLTMSIATHEMRVLWRDKTFILLSVILLLLSSYTIFSSVSLQTDDAHAHAELTDTVRKMMVGQKPISPHMAGHYGHVVFKPANFLQAIDPGVNVFAGTTVRLEAHRQNEAVFAQAAGNSSLVRFGEFSFSLLLQVVIPLLIIFSCYRAVIADRQSGTLKLLISQGISMRRLVGAKILAYWGMYLFFLIVSLLLYGILFYLQAANGLGQGSWGRLLLILMLYGLYYFLLISVTVYCSAHASKASALLTGLLSAWFICTVIIPKWAANAGAQASTLPTRFEVNAAVKKMKEGGINGHDKKNPKTLAFIDSVLKANGADSVSQLPFKIGGLLMQADEDFNNAVYDKSLSKISNTVRAQNQVGAWSSFLNPFMSIRNLSMALSGTDTEHHFHFTKSVEDYRRRLITKLNSEDALRGSANKEGGKLTRSFWEQMADFRYPAPTLQWSIGNHLTELLALGLWVLGMSAIILFTTNKIKLT